MKKATISENVIPATMSQNPKRSSVSLEPCRCQAFVPHVDLGLDLLARLPEPSAGTAAGTLPSARGQSPGRCVRRCTGWRSSSGASRWWSTGTCTRSARRSARRSRCPTGRRRKRRDKAGAEHNDGPLERVCLELVGRDGWIDGSVRIDVPLGRLLGGRSGRVVRAHDRRVLIGGRAPIITAGERRDCPRRRGRAARSPPPSAGSRSRSHPGPPSRRAPGPAPG